jgi:Mrp family chromosome partitioning ATPase
MSPGNRGACIWFTGLSGSGKSTLAVELVPLLHARGREVTVLDGEWCGRTSPRVSATPVRTVTPTSDAWATWPPRSFATAGWPWLPW